MAETASTTYTYCGEPEPTDACERGGWCDYHLGAMPGGWAPWDLGQVVPFDQSSRPSRVTALVDAAFGMGEPGPKTFDELKAQEARLEPAHGAPYWYDCTCLFECADDPRTACSLSGAWHVHAGEPCPVHPDAAGDR